MTAADQKLNIQKLILERNCQTTEDAWRVLYDAGLLPHHVYETDSRGFLAKLCFHCHGCGLDQTIDSATMKPRGTQCRACRAKAPAVQQVPDVLDACVAVAANPQTILDAEYVAHEFIAALLPWTEAPGGFGIVRWLPSRVHWRLTESEADRVVLRVPGLTAVFHFLTEMLGLAGFSVRNNPVENPTAAVSLQACTTRLNNGAKFWDHLAKAGLLYPDVTKSPHAAWCPEAYRGKRLSDVPNPLTGLAQLGQRYPGLTLIDLAETHFTLAMPCASAYVDAHLATPAVPALAETRAKDAEAKMRENDKVLTHTRAETEEYRRMTERVTATHNAQITLFNELREKARRMELDLGKIRAEVGEAEMRRILAPEPGPAKG